MRRRSRPGRWEFIFSGGSGRILITHSNFNSMCNCPIFRASTDFIAMNELKERTKGDANHYIDFRAFSGLFRHPVGRPRRRSVCSNPNLASSCFTLTGIILASAVITGKSTRLNQLSGRGVGESQKAAPTPAPPGVPREGKTGRMPV